MLDVSKSIIDCIVELDQKVSTGMTEFQMEHFVINEQGTPYRMARQAIIEVRGRMENLVTLEIDLDELKEKIQDPYVGAYAKRRFELERDRKSKMAEQGRREIEFFSKMLEKVVYENFGSFEEYSKLLDDPEWVKEEEGKYWIHTLTSKARDDIYAIGTISQGVAGALHLLPKELSKKAFDVLHDKVQETSKLRLPGIK